MAFHFRNVDEVADIRDELKAGLAIEFDPDDIPVIRRAWQTFVQLLVVDAVLHFFS